MSNRQKLKYNPYFVREEYRRKICGELMLPSGKPSGYELYPVTDADIYTVRSTYNFPPKEALETAEAENVHEWMLWVAARLKYGVNYLNRRLQFRLPDHMYGRIKEVNEFEIARQELERLVDYRVDTLAEILIKQGPQEVKKNYRDHLTFEISDV